MKVIIVLLLSCSSCFAQPFVGGGFLQGLHAKKGDKLATIYSLNAGFSFPVVKGLGVDVVPLGFSTVMIDRKPSYSFQVGIFARYYFPTKKVK